MKLYKATPLYFSIFMILLVSLGFIHIYKQNKIPASPITSPSTIQIITYTKDQIKEIKVTNDKHSLTYIPTADAWVLKNIGEISVDQTSLNYTGNSMLSLEATLTITSQNLSVYGLDYPSKIIDYHLKDGSSVQLLIGKTTADGGQTYVKTSLADSSIYTIPTDICNAFKSHLSDFHITKLDTIDISKISCFTIVGKDIPRLTISLNDDCDNLFSPYTLSTDYFKNAATDSAALEHLFKLIPEFTVDGFIADNVTDLSLYGLDHPELTLHIETTSYNKLSSKSYPFDENGITKMTYKWGNTTENGMIYFMKEGTDCVYAMDSSFISKLKVAATPYTLMNKYLYLTHWNFIDSATITIDSKSYTLKKVSAKPATYSINHTKLTEEAFKQIYGKLISIRCDKPLSEPSYNKLSPVVTITYKLKDESLRTFHLYAYNNEYYAGMLQNKMSAAFNIRQFTYLEELLSHY